MIYISATSDTIAHCQSCSSYDDGQPYAILLSLVAGALVVAVALALAGGARIQQHSPLALSLVPSPMNLTHHAHPRPHPRSARKMVPRLPMWAQRLFWQRGTTNAIKIIFGFYFIAANVSHVYDVRLPRFVQDLMFVAQVVTSLGLQGLSFWLPCVGIQGYLMRLQFWMALPAGVAIVIVLMAALHLVWRGQLWNPKEHRSVVLRVVLTALPWILRGAFLIFPIVTTTAFEAWVCTPELDKGLRFLSTDVGVECHDPTVEAWALLALVLYPMGLWLVFAALLTTHHHCIVSNRPTPLSEAIFFLYQPYCRTYATFWWELAEVSASVLHYWPLSQRRRHVLRCASRSHKRDCSTAGVARERSPLGSSLACRCCVGSCCSASRRHLCSREAASPSSPLPSSSALATWSSRCKPSRLHRRWTAGSPSPAPSAS